MRKFFFMMITMLSMAVSSQAMSYEQARQQALFLADKMAYELNLTEEQYEACYEINLDYLMGVTGEADLYGDYWTRRNLDMSYILLDWQYRAFLDASYFYRPLYWQAGCWHFGVYARYPHRTYFYFGRPTFWNTYRGAHSWIQNGNRSWYNGRNYAHRGPGINDNHGRPRAGMRDNFNRGNYGRGENINSGKRNDRLDRGSQSSTRSTVGNIHRGNDNVNRGNSTVRRENNSVNRDNNSVGHSNNRRENNVNRGNDTRPQRGTSGMSSSSSSAQRHNGASMSGSRSHSSAGSHNGGASSHNNGGVRGGRR